MNAHENENYPFPFLFLEMKNFFFVSRSCRRFFGFETRRLSEEWIHQDINLR